MTAELLVLQFVDDGKLTVADAVQLLETLAEEEPDEREWPEKKACVEVCTSTHAFFSVELYQGATDG